MEEEEDGPKVGGRSWKPQVHYVWDILLDELLPSQESEVTPKGSFQEFFRIVVDGKRDGFMLWVAITNSCPRIPICFFRVY